MRLTLRTLLAYLDEMLEPADADSLREKLSQTEQASQITHRIQDVVRRLRIGAPKISDKGLAADANNVAEYLDNTMSPAKVADFERACLESDVHLAEAAACHQILALVLREQADVDATTRQRMYELVERATNPTPLAVAQTATPPIEPASLVSTYTVVEEAAEPRPVETRAERRRPEVPDYLREEPRSQWWPIAAATLMLAALVGALYVAVAGPELPPWLGGKQQVAQGNDTPPPPTEPPAPAAPGAPPAPTDVTANPPAPGTVPPAEDPAPTNPADNPFATTDPGALPVEPAPTPSAPGPQDPAQPTNPPAPVEQPGMPTNDQTPPLTDPAAPAAPAPPPGEPAAPAPAPPAEPTPPPPIDVAPVAKQDALILRFDPDVPGWQRLIAGDVIRSDERLLILPVFRPVIVLKSGPSLEPLGPTSFRLLGPNADGVEGIAMDYGQIKVFANGTADGRVRFVVGGRETLLHFVDPEAVAAVDMGFWRNPGDDPQKIRPIEVFGAYAIAGRVDWTDPAGGGQPREFTGPAMIVQPTSPIGPLATDLPLWLSPDISPLIDRKAAGQIADEVLPERSVVLTLKEQSDRPQMEIRSLAARCLCQMGEFDAALRMLDDRELRSYWDDLVQSLISAVNRGPVEAQRVRDAMTTPLAAQAEPAYRMLWGYSNEQLATGADQQLVDALEAESLVIRRLAIWNLSTITGSTMLYAPEQQSTRARQTAMQKWRAKLKRGEIRYGGVAAPGAPAEEPPPGADPLLDGEL